ncbi:MAG: hypothetical protein HC768_24335 [Acaryochloris sp. CRU_2_0]|nr:hypothetical protein [Acaryochloris sp. CRU_2_0]
MDLTAKRKKQQSAPANLQEKEALSVNASSEDTFTHSITIRYSTLLYTTLQNMISAAHTANDFTYTSVADVVRAALQAYKEGMELSEPDEPSEKKQTSIRVNSVLLDFYKSWPNQMRTKILERAIRTYIKTM